MKNTIESIWDDKSLLDTKEARAAVAEVMEKLDTGVLRCASPDGDGGWVVNDWVKKAVVLNFPI